MAQFDVFRFPSTTDLLLDVQSSRLSHFSVRMVVPLLPKTPFLTPAERLNPKFVIEDETYIMMTHYMTSVPASELRNRIANLDRHQYAIKAALDMLFYGF